MTKLEKYLIDKIEQAKPHIIEAFVNQYGDKYKDFIIDRIVKTKVLICHGDIDKYYVLDLARKYTLNKIDDKNIKEGIISLSNALTFKNNYSTLVKNEFKKVIPQIKLDNFYYDSFYKGLSSFFETDPNMSQTEINKYRVYYYKCMGLNLGSHYSQYKDKKIVQLYTPSKKMKKDLDKIYDKLINLKDDADKMINLNKEEITKELIDLGFSSIKLKEYTNVDLNDNLVSYTMKNFLNNQLNPVCAFNLKDITFTDESGYLHEFSHALDFRMDKSGFKVGDNFELLNEAFNEASIRPIYQYMIDHDYGIIYKHPGRYSYLSYPYLSRIGEALYDKFKDYIGIIKFGTKEELFNLVDEKTLENWNTACIALFQVKEAGSDYQGYKKLIESNIIESIKTYKILKR